MLQDYDSDSFSSGSENGNFSARNKDERMMVAEALAQSSSIIPGMYQFPLYYNYFFT